MDEKSGFQFLIGNLVTPGPRPGCCLGNGFQFLIGNLVTLLGRVLLVNRLQFQFLIGNLVTYTERHTKRHTKTVSIPYRKPSNIVAVLAEAPNYYSFNSL